MIVGSIVFGQPSPQAVGCVLCELYGGSHPDHPEAPRYGDKDYGRLAAVQAAGRDRWLARLGRTNPSCWRKDAYPSRRVARIYARRIGNPSVRPFHCPHCLQWHIGKGERVGA